MRSTRTCLFNADLTVFSDISLVSNKQFDDIRGSIFFYIFCPSYNILKGVLLCNVICYYDSIGTSVVALSDSPKPFLSGCIPYLQLEFYKVIKFSMY